MKKVYALVQEWGSNNEEGLDIVGVYRRKKDARKALDDTAERMMADESYKYDTTEYIAGEYFTTYDNGWYTNGFDTFFIVESELHE